MQQADDQDGSRKGRISQPAREIMMRWNGSMAFVIARTI